MLYRNSRTQKLIFSANPTKNPPNPLQKSTREEKSKKARTTEQKKVRVSDR